MSIVSSSLFIYLLKAFIRSDGGDEEIFLDCFVKEQGASSEYPGKKPNDVHTKDHGCTYYIHIN